MAVSAAMITAKFTPEDLHMYRVTFEQFDEDGSGKIDVGELQRALRGCGIECTGDEVIAMMSTVDESGDLEIDFDEFLQLIYNFRTEQEYASTSDSSDDDEGGGADGERRGGGAARTTRNGGAAHGSGTAATTRGGFSSYGSLGFGGDEGALYGLSSLNHAAGGGAGRTRRVSNPSHRASISIGGGAGGRGSLSLDAAGSSLGGNNATNGGSDPNDAAAASPSSHEDDVTMLHRRRVAAVTQCPEHNLRALVGTIRGVREDLVREISNMVGDSADDERRITMIVLQRLLGAKCPFVPSGSFIATVRARREHQIAAMLSSNGGDANSNSSNKAATSGGENDTSTAGGSSPPPPPAVGPPSLTQIIAFIDELLDAANERLMRMVDMTYAYNSDGLYDSAQEAAEEMLSKQQQELLKLVEAAAAVSVGSGARAAKNLQSGGGGQRGSMADTGSSSEDDDDDEGADDETETGDSKRASTATKSISGAAAAGGRSSASTTKSVETANSRGNKATPLSMAGGRKSTSATKGGGTPVSSSSPAAGSPPSTAASRSGKKVSAALDNLSSFTFELERSADQKIGSDAFRAAAKKFPYFMFPIGSVCAIIDNLEKVHDTYEQIIAGKEYLVKPRCKDGAKCHLLGILEHQLALSHPCYSETIPCPHRHRPLHMTCYHHDEDEGPSARATRNEIEKQLYILDLSNLEMGDTGAKCIAQVLSRDIALRGKERHRIRHLKIGGNQISPEGAAALFEHCGHLITLDISNNGLGYKGSVLNGSAIGPSLQKLLTTSESLIELNLSRNRLSDRDAKYMTEALKDNAFLTTLDLQKNEFGSLFGGHMASALQENPYLKHISVGWNRLESFGTTTLLAEVCKTSSIEYLDLSWTGVSDEGAKLLADFITGSQTVVHLGLAHNSITGDGLITLKGAESQKTLSKAIQSSKSLTSLDLSFNNLGPKASRDFLRDLRENFVLENVDIRCVKAADDISDEVGAYVKVRAGPPSTCPVAVQFGSMIGGVGGPTNPIRAEKMGLERQKASQMGNSTMSASKRR